MLVVVMASPQPASLPEHPSRDAEDKDAGGGHKPALVFPADHVIADGERNEGEDLKDDRTAERRCDAQ